MFFLALLLTNAKLVYSAEKFFLSADTISKNEENNTIKATGNVNITNNQEFLMIAEAFSLKKQKQAANAILKIIFVKKNPDKFENINDWIKIFKKKKLFILILFFKKNNNLIKINTNSRRPIKPEHIKISTNRLCG